ncbi:hypothetical protein [Campylobacter sputorum]|uniref:hypothetical protein n=1 Tax=Campylobacter sputorum TaxID=206 RepID=UPI00053C077E|nr:hypothetical protein [Campylobacter sputorum]
MKKIVILGSLGAISILSACLCATDITNAFNNLTNKIATSVDSQTNIIKTNLIPQVTKNITLLEEENKLIETLINQEKDILLKDKEMIFELKKKNKLL